MVIDAQSLAGKRILLGVTGSISAYKSALLVRLFVKAGAEVRVIMTEAASHFIPALTLSTLSHNEVLSSFERAEGGLWNNHVELGLWADLMVIAPATAQTLASAANGLCPNLLLATYLSARCPVVWCPAMDLDMYAHPATVQNLERLQSFGNHVIEAESGELASGLSGQGRLAEPEHILDWVRHFFNVASSKAPTVGLNQDLVGKTVMITAGPTHEAIDPVRFIGNHSTGKMGIAMADAATHLGARVILVLGPTHLRPQSEKVSVILVQSAQDMLAACQQYAHEAHVCIFAAAVADYRVATVAEQKIKKQSGEDFAITLVQNPDIAKTIGNTKRSDQVMIGFALETENLLAYAQGKLRAKNMDMIVLNDAKQQGAGFGADTNIVTFVTENGSTELPLLPKSEVANAILDFASRLLNTKLATQLETHTLPQLLVL